MLLVVGVQFFIYLLSEVLSGTVCCVHIVSAVSRFDFLLISRLVACVSVSCVDSVVLRIGGMNTGT